MRLVPKSKHSGPEWAKWLGVMVALLAFGLLAAACSGDDDADTVTGDRITISLAVLDDPSRRAALYGIEQAITTSDTVDLDITYLPLSTIIDVAPAKQYDIIEATPLAVPRAAAADFDFVVLSAALRNLDGTFLFVSADSDIEDPGDLSGKTIAVPSLGGTFTLETRYLLQETYGLDVSLESGDVRIIESPAESLPTLLSNGDVDAAVMLHLGAFRVLEDESFRVLSQVTDEVQLLTAGPVMNSILVTYPDVAAQKADALDEVNRLLAESVTYFKANQEDVIQAVAADQEVDPAFLTWWWERQDLLLGDLSIETQEQLLAVWNAAIAIGDIEEFPELATVIFNSEVLGTESEE